jgi:hypothetical protein
MRNQHEDDARAYGTYYPAELLMRGEVPWSIETEGIERRHPNTHVDQ